MLKSQQRVTPPHTSGASSAGRLERSSICVSGLPALSLALPAAMKKASLQDSSKSAKLYHWYGSNSYLINWVKAAANLLRLDSLAPFFSPGSWAAYQSDLLNIGETFGFGTGLSYIIPSKRDLTIGRPYRIPLLMIHCHPKDHVYLLSCGRSWCLLWISLITNVRTVRGFNCPAADIFPDSI
jgi:hypothetical protein